MERPVVKDKAILAYVEELESQIEKFIKSPFSEGYVTVKSIIDKWNKEISEGHLSILDDEDNGKFTRAHKYFTELKPYYDMLDYFRTKMTAEEIKDSDNAAMKYATKGGRN